MDPTRRTILAAAAGVPIAAGAFYLGTRFGRRSQPAFRRLTFRRGYLRNARFGPDGQAVYDAAWEGGPSRIFAGSRPLDIPPARLLSVSRAGELAILLPHESTLARVPAAGGSPREVLRNVQSAEWSPDGASFLIVRQFGSKDRIEFPIGQTWHESLVPVSGAALSPDGRRIGFTDGTSLYVMERSRPRRTLVAKWTNLSGIVWPPGGKEVWFSGSRDSSPAAICAVDLDGRIRTVTAMTSAAALQDISADGRVLLTSLHTRAAMMCQPPGAAAERDLSWLDFSIASDIAEDGSAVLFSESHAAARAENAASLVFLRKTDGSDAVSLGAGRALGLSPDGRWAAAIVPGAGRQLVVLPAGAGERRVLTADRFTYEDARWFPDGKRLLVYGNEDERLARHYVQDAAGGAIRAITSEGSGADAAISADGEFVAAHAGPGIFLFPVDGSEPQPVRGNTAGAVPVAWSDNSRSLFLRRGTQVYLADIKSGKAELWKDLTPPDATGVIAIDRLSIVQDGNAYVYSSVRTESELYLAEGLR